MRIESNQVSGTAGKRFHPGKVRDGSHKVSDKVTIGSTSSGIDDALDKKLASLRRSGTARKTKKPSSIKSFLQRATRIMLIGFILLGPIGIAGCGGSGGKEPVDNRPAAVQVEKKAGRVAQPAAGKTETVSIFDRFITKEAREQLTGIAQEAGKVLKDPRGAKDKVIEVVRETAGEAKKAAVEAAKDFVKGGSEEVVESAEKLKNSSTTENIQENAQDVIEKGTDYTKQKVEQANKTLEETRTATKKASEQGKSVLEETKKAGKSAMDFWNELKEGYQSGKTRGDTTGDK